MCPIINAHFRGVPADPKQLRHQAGESALAQCFSQHDWPMVVAQAEFMRRSEGCAILFTSNASLAGDLMRFDFSRFIPAIIKYRLFVLEVLIVSMVLQLVSHDGTSIGF